MQRVQHFIRRAGARGYAQSLKDDWSGAASVKPRKAVLSALQSTVLPNGVTVVSSDDLSPASSVQVFVKAGTRYETAATVGSAQFISALAFQDTANRSALHITRETELHGITTHSAYNQDHIVFGVSGLRNEFHYAFDNLSDAVTGPLFHSWEVSHAKHRVERQSAAAPFLQLLSDEANKTAFRQGLGNRQVATAGTIANATSGAIQKFAAAQFTGANLTIVGAGVNHDELVHSAKKNFASVVAGGAAPPAAKYFGGESYVEAGQDGVSVVLAYQAAGLAGAPAFHILRELLGAHAAVQYGGAHGALQKGLVGGTAQAIYQPHADTGLLLVVAQAANADISNVAKHSFGALQKVLGGHFTAADVSRAKNAAKLAVLGASRAERNNIIGVFGKSPEDVAAAIDAVDESALKAAAKAAGSSKLTYVAHGNAFALPYADSL